MEKNKRNGFILVLILIMLVAFMASLLFLVAPKRSAKAEEDNSNIICVFETSAPNTTTCINSVFYSSIDWGDGTIDNTMEHTYESAGTYTVIISGFQNIIPTDAFSFNSEIKSAVLPSQIIHICTGVFDECSNFTSIVIYAITPPILDSFALPRNIEEILVPASSVDAYKAAEGFSSFADIISAISEEELDLPSESIDDFEGVILTFEVNDRCLVSISVEGLTSADWGDGTVDTLKKHTYSESGIYTAKFYGVYKFRSFFPLDAKSFVIGSNVNSVNSSYMCYVENVFVSENNEFYKTIDGNLYSKDGTVLYSYLNSRPVKVFTIPDFVTEVKNYAFSECENNLEKLIIGSSVLSFDGEFCSQNIYHLVNIVVSAYNPNYSSEDGIFYDKGKTKIIYCYSGKSGNIVLLDTVKHIERLAFYRCDYITNIVIPDGVENIDEENFNFCSGLISIVIPDSVYSLGFDAFYGCSNLSSVVLGSGIDGIPTGSFTDCDNLKTLTLRAEEPVCFDYANAYENLQAIYVPAEIVDDYKVEFGWSDYADIIFAIPQEGPEQPVEVDESDKNIQEEPSESVESVTDADNKNPPKFWSDVSKTSDAFYNWLDGHKWVIVVGSCVIVGALAYGLFGLFRRRR